VYRMEFTEIGLTLTDRGRKSVGSGFF